MKNRFTGFLAAGVVSLAAIATPASATPFVIDETASSLTWGGAIVLAFFQLEEQSPGSSESALSGSFDAVITGPMGGETVMFVGSNAIELADLGVEGTPAFGPSASGDDLDIDDVDADGSFDDFDNDDDPDVLPDNPTDGIEGDGLFTVGRTNVLLQNGPANADIAFRNLVLTLGGTGVADGSAATAVEIGILEGWLAANTTVAGANNVEIFLGTDGETTPNSEEITGSIAFTSVPVPGGFLETITVPIELSFGDITEDPVELSIVGQVVASRIVNVIPEPTSALFLASLAGAGAVVRRRRK